MRRNLEVGVCIEKVESSRALAVRPDKGTVISLHAGASGKAIMAFLSPAEQQKIIKQKGLPKIGPNTIVDPDELQKDLARIKEQGFAASDQEIYHGVRALSAPVFGPENRVMASVGIAGPRERFGQEQLESMTGPVIKTARDISLKLGQQAQPAKHQES